MILDATAARDISSPVITSKNLALTNKPPKTNTSSTNPTQAPSPPHRRSRCLHHPVESYATRRVYDSAPPLFKSLLKALQTPPAARASATTFSCMCDMCDPALLTNATVALTASRPLKRARTNTPATADAHSCSSFASALATATCQRCDSTFFRRRSICPVCASRLAPPPLAPDMRQRHRYPRTLYEPECDQDVDVPSVVPQKQEKLDIDISSQSRRPSPLVPQRVISNNSACDPMFDQQCYSAYDLSLSPPPQMLQIVQWNTQYPMSHPIQQSQQQTTLQYSNHTYSYTSLDFATSTRSSHLNEVAIPEPNHSLSQWGIGTKWNLRTSIDCTASTKQPNKEEAVPELVNVSCTPSSTTLSMDSLCDKHVQTIAEMLQTDESMFTTHIAKQHTTFESSYLSDLSGECTSDSVHWDSEADTPVPLTTTGDLKLVTPIGVSKLLCGPDGKDGMLDKMPLHDVMASTVHEDSADVLTSLYECILPAI